MASLAALPRLAAQAGAGIGAIERGWKDPPRSCRMHTRWWWPGSAVTREGITSQLEAMRAQGLGGVEIMSCWEMFEKGNLAYLSPAWEEMMRHAVREAERLGMEVAFTFGPGWDFGGFWVAPEDRSKCLAAAWVDLDGPARFEGDLPRPDIPEPKGFGFENPSLVEGNPRDQGAVVAVVAARLLGQGLDGSTLTDLTAEARDGRLSWRAPEGRWRLAVFRLQYTGQQNSAQNFQPPNFIADHFNEGAMRRFCGYLAARFEKAFRPWLGKTVDSWFADSWELRPLDNTVLWSKGTLDDFRRLQGYDLRKYLPAIWWDIGAETPRVRYDINECLHKLGLEITFRAFVECCARAGVAARVQPHYRFTTEIVEAAGAAPRPETEVTTARFETVPDPRKATVAGARFYGRDFVSAEAYTFIHRERYRTTLEEMKAATDAFLRDGVTQFYNHGFFYSPEKDVAPLRDMPWAERISPWMPWWPYLKHLSAYVARCCWMLRQGRFAGDVLIYSPQAAEWTKKVLYNIERRVMPYGTLPKTLVANGYDYDPVNDDLLQNHARAARGCVVLRGHSYRFLILQRITDLPVKTMRAIRGLARAGVCVIALDALPERGTGLLNHDASSREVAELVKETFGAGGPGVFLPRCKFRHKPFESNEQPYRKTPPAGEGDRELLAVMRRVLEPDFVIGGGKQSDGLTFHHRRAPGSDIYFVTNLQPEAAEETVSFRVAGRPAEFWDPMSGERKPAPPPTVREGRTEIPVRLEPWESVFVVFRAGALKPRVAAKPVELPAPLPLEGPWRLTLEGVRFSRTVRQGVRLASWTSDEELQYFSGVGAYELEFELPAAYVRPGLDLWLDLGAVGCVADVSLNGAPQGVRILRPYRVRLRAVRAGRNSLVVKVANTLAHHVAGMKEPPPLAAELEPHYGRTPPPRERWLEPFKRDVTFRPLPDSGLMGPVRIVARASGES